MTIADLAFPMCQNHAMSPSIMICQTGALSMEALNSGTELWEKKKKKSDNVAIVSFSCMKLDKVRGNGGTVMLGMIRNRYSKYEKRHFP